MLNFREKIKKSFVNVLTFSYVLQKYKLSSNLNTQIENLKSNAKKSVDVLIHPDRKDKYLELRKDFIEITPRIY